MHTKTLPDGTTLNIDKLLTLLLLSGRLRVLRAISEIKPVSASPESGYTEERYVQADYNFPVLIDEDGFVLDGRHRLLKAIDEGKTKQTTLTATREEIELCLVTR